MGRFLWGLYLKHRPAAQASRERHGAFAGAVGVVCNLLLFAFKFAVGLIAGSIAMIADSINNFFDAASSIVTLIGFKIAQKPADREHPFGHARVEYLSGAFISIVMILIGFELLQSSFGKIINPTAVSFSMLSFVVLGVSILAKIWMYSFLRFSGKRIQSATLLVAAKESRNDVIETTVILVGAAAQFVFEMNLDGWLGAAVAAFIILSGIMCVKDTLSPLLGEGPPKELVSQISNAIQRHDGVLGMHDLMVHAYGPNRLFATVHIEIAAQTDPLVGHGIIDRIERDIEAQLGIRLVAHYDPVDAPNEQTAAVDQQLTALVYSIDASLTIHDLRTIKINERTTVVFDVGVPPGYESSTENLKGWVTAGVAALDGGYDPVVQIDRNYLMPE